MTSDDRFGLRPLWDAMLAIYGEIAKICERHGLRYYVTDGTALGAMRHKGFIPWDDDFDISMPRPDYEAFKQFAGKELPANLKFIDRKNTPEFAMLFGKVQETSESFVRSIETKIGHALSGGICVDIFPIEGFPDGTLKRRWYKFVDFVLGRALVYRRVKFRGGSLKDKMFVVCSKLFSLLTPWMKTEADYLQVLESMARSSDFDICAYTARTCSQRTIFRRPPLRKEIWGKPKPMEFDNTIVMGPEDCAAYLGNEFNKWDWHELPPSDKQHPTHSYAKRCAWWLGPTDGMGERNR